MMSEALQVSRPIANGTQPLAVLIADDEAGIRRVVATTVGRLGLTAMIAVDGADAMAQSISHPPDIAIVDLSMPHVNGLEVVRQLKALAPLRPVLVMSGANTFEERIAAFEAGADDFVQKPFQARELAKRLQAHARHLLALRDLQRVGEEASHLRMFASEAAALLAHDLNNGLAIVKANLEYLGEVMPGCAAFDDEAADASDGARRALVRMIALVKNFVDISRLEESTLTPKRVDTNIASIAHAVSQIHQPRRSESGVEIEVDVPGDLDARIDPTLTERILHNLVGNASRYVNRGGYIRISARTEEAGSGVVLILGVTNTGPKVPVELRATLFEKFTKGRDQKAQSGMGLYFCRLAAEAHGGGIRLLDGDLGASFEVRLPAGEAAGPLGLALGSVLPGRLKAIRAVSQG